MANDILLRLSQEQAIVLFDWLSRNNDRAWDGDLLTVSSDICFSDGRYIAEGTATRERDSDDREEWLTEQVQAASALFASNLDTLRYLVRPSGPGSGGSGITAHPLE